MASKKTRTPAIDIGITDLERKKIADGLSALLADSYTLYLMTHNFHWNVTGPQFNSLHNMFMGQYTEQWNALDMIAERIRALGHPAPGTYREFAKLASFGLVKPMIDLDLGHTRRKQGIVRQRLAVAAHAVCNHLQLF